MEPISLLTATLSLLTPFINKTGEKIAEGIGENIWNWLKKSFHGKKEIFKENFEMKGETNQEKLKQILLEKINSDTAFKKRLEELVKENQNFLDSHLQQNITNNGTINKQLNITNNSGTINLS